MNIFPGQFVPAAPHPTNPDQPGTGTIDFTSAQTFLSTLKKQGSLNRYRYFAVFADTGTLLVCVGSSAAPPIAPDGRHPRVYQGTWCLFPLRDDGTPNIQVKALSGTVTGIAGWVI